MYFMIIICHATYMQIKSIIPHFSNKTNNKKIIRTLANS